MKKIVYVLIVALLAGVYLGCSDDDSPTKPKPDTVLKVIVKSAADTTVVVVNANVVVYQAETSQAVTRALTGTAGECSFKLDQGNYYVSVTAQGYDASPAPNVTPVPFFVTTQATTTQTRKLIENDVSGSGYIIGAVSPVIGNVLVIAENTADLERYSGITGPDGVFIIYNVPLGIYDIKGIKAGYKQSVAVTDTLTVETQNDQVDIALEAYSGSILTGKLSFIAGAEAKKTDIVLRDPKTLDIIPGLVTYTNALNNEFAFNSIPDGEFILWASLENDSNVMDPDKNLGGINVMFPGDTGAFKQIDITGAIDIVSPTNPPDSIYAFQADSIRPLFTWTKQSSYSSVKEYIIEVRDINGKKIWGGFEGTVIQHEQISGSALSYRYPDSAPALIPGEIYQWKIYADNDAAADIQGLLSSSEDLMGLFKVVLPPEEPVK
jgi:hypothetical protein